MEIIREDLVYENRRLLQKLRLENTPELINIFRKELVEKYYMKPICDELLYNIRKDLESLLSRIKIESNIDIHLDVITMDNTIKIIGKTLTDTLLWESIGILNIE